MLGIYQGGRAVIEQSRSAQWRADELQPPHVDTPQNQAVLDNVLLGFLGGYLA